jgi:hypothetical protein
MRFSYRTSQAFPNGIDATRVIIYMIEKQEENVPKLCKAL